VADVKITINQKEELGKVLENMMKLYTRAFVYSGNVKYRIICYKGEVGIVLKKEEDYKIIEITDKKLEILEVVETLEKLKSFCSKVYKSIPIEFMYIDLQEDEEGRLAVIASTLLRGKHKPIYTPSMDTGDFVVIVNAEKVAVSGKKAEQKEYIHHTGWPGGFRSVKYNKLMAEQPTRIVEHAIRGMLPHNRMGRALYTKLKVYAGPEHPHAAQQPLVYDARKEAFRG
jgi:large subunit ribosomal protein L13